MNNQGAHSLAELQGYLDKLAADDVFSGSVLVAQNSAPMFSYACGLASKSFNAPNQIDTKFNLASMNKMFTGVAICQLAQQGKLDFNDCVGQHLPDYLNSKVAKQVTLHQLLTHTSGMGSYWNEQYGMASKDRFRQIRDYFPLFVDDPLAFEPGERWEYSNAGFMVLGAIIESVSGQNYFDYVRERIYIPAGMFNTDAYEMDRDTPNRAIGYTKLEGESQPCNNLYIHGVKGGPAGGGFSTVEDLLKFDIALRDGRLLGPNYEQLLLSNKVPTPDPKFSYAYGFFETRSENARFIGHDGAFAGISSELRMYIETGHTIAVLSNYDPPIAEQIADWIEKRLFPNQNS